MKEETKTKSETTTETGTTTQEEIARLDIWRRQRERTTQVRSTIEISKYNYISLDYEL